MNDGRVTTGSDQEQREGEWARDHGAGRGAGGQGEQETLIVRLQWDASLFSACVSPPILGPDHASCIAVPLQSCFLCPGTHSFFHWEINPLPSEAVSRLT